MKKIIISLALVVFVFAGTGVANAQVVQYADLQQQYQSLLMQLIQLLTQRIAELQTQLAAMTTVQAPIVNSLSTSSEPIVNQPSGGSSTVTESQVSATSTAIDTSTASSTAAALPPARDYTPAITIKTNDQEISEFTVSPNDYVRFVWNVTGYEPINCTNEGVQVAQYGSKEILVTASTSFTLSCVGTQTASHAEKTVQINVR